MWTDQLNLGSVRGNAGVAHLSKVSGMFTIGWGSIAHLLVRKPSHQSPWRYGRAAVYTSWSVDGSLGSRQSRTQCGLCPSAKVSGMFAIGWESIAHLLARKPSHQSPWRYGRAAVHTSWGVDGSFSAVSNAMRAMPVYQD